MNQFLFVGQAFACLALLVGGWLGWQLLRQNGRLLLRLDELEQRLDESEVGEAGSPKGLSVGSEAPAIELPDLEGNARTLAEFRGRPALLIFFNPDCGFCHEMMPKLAAMAAGFQPAVQSGILPPGEGVLLNGARTNLRDASLSDGNSAGLEARLNGRRGCLPPQVLILTIGDVEQNRAFIREHQITCPVLMQKGFAVTAAYQANGTPSGYLISPEGKIASELAMGADALLALATKPRGSRCEEAHLEESEILDPKSEIDESLVTSATSRFGNRSLARSKIKRDGLKAGAPAPDFRLPRLDGRGDLTLSELRGRRVLLVFSDPHCDPCNTLAPELEKFHRNQRPLTLSPSEGAAAFS